MNSSHTAIYSVHILPIYPAWKGSTCCHLIPTFVAVKINVRKRPKQPQSAVQREQEVAEAAQRAAEAAPAAVEELAPWIRGKNRWENRWKTKMKTWTNPPF